MAEDTPPETPDIPASLPETGPAPRNWKDRLAEARRARERVQAAQPAAKETRQLTFPEAWLPSAAWPRSAVSFRREGALRLAALLAFLRRPRSIPNAAGTALVFAVGAGLGAVLTAALLARGTGAPSVVLAAPPVGKAASLRSGAGEVAAYSALPERLPPLAGPGDPVQLAAASSGSYQLRERAMPVAFTSATHIAAQPLPLSPEPEKAAYLAGPDVSEISGPAMTTLDRIAFRTDDMPPAVRETANGLEDRAAPAPLATDRPPERPDPISLGLEALPEARVFMHAPSGVSGERLRDLMGQLRSGGTPVEEVGFESFRVSATHIRYYSPRTAETAARIAGRIGVEARDFSHVRLSDSRVELWVSGRPGTPDTERESLSGTALQRYDDALFGR